MCWFLIVCLWYNLIHSSCSLHLQFLLPRLFFKFLNQLINLFSLFQVINYFINLNLSGNVSIDQCFYRSRNLNIHQGMLLPNPAIKTVGTCLNLIGSHSSPRLKAATSPSQGENSFFQTFKNGNINKICASANS